MTRARAVATLAALLALATLAGPAAADSSQGARSSGSTSVYGLGAGIGWGRGMVRPTSDPAEMRYLRYTELNGIVGKMIIIISGTPMEPTPTVSNVNSSTSCDTYTCTTTTTWTETPVTEEQWEQYHRDVEEHSKQAAAIMAGAIPLEFSFDLALRSLGGDASGFSTELLWREPFTGFLGMPLAELSFGFNWTRYSFSGVTRREARFVDDSTIAIDEVAPDTTYHSLGFPVRLMVFPFPRLAFYARLDLNMFTLAGALIDSVKDDGELNSTYYPNLSHAGIVGYLGIAYLRGDVAIDGGDIESLMFTGEFGLQF